MLSVLQHFTKAAVFAVAIASAPSHAQPATPAFPKSLGESARCERVVKAEIVALEQAIVLNRFGAFNPSGMLFALMRDVVFSGHPDIKDDTPVSSANLSQAPGFVKLREDKRPRPIVLRANEGDCLQVRFHNLLMRGVPDERSGGSVQNGGKVPAHLQDPDGTVYGAPAARTGRELVQPSPISNDLPLTRAASFHVNGLNVVPVPRSECPLATPDHPWLCGTDGDNVGLNEPMVHAATPEPLRSRLLQQGGQVYPGQSAVYRMYAFREGTYFAYSTGATVAGEGDGGQLGAGLFGAVNVQPRGARWYRSQITHNDLRAASRSVATGRHPYSSLDYDGARYASGAHKGIPILAMLDGQEIVHSDLNAIVVLSGASPDGNDTTGPARHCSDYATGNSCGRSYREFTVVMHDEVKAVQAFAELEDEGNPLHYIKDGMGINYGVGGMGAMVVARNRRTGPAKDCPECKAEEFFLSSWANGDPALVLKWGANGKKPEGAMYPDDPSNVHHSYINDPVRFRNLHAGPKETHVFHLHAHQWVADISAPGSTYLDSQTISPGATFSYEIEFGGTGNRNLTPGDSIFHCHLYPHFAQGMWELWRAHDVFEDGSAGRRLPDAEVTGGTENPALVPLPGTALALMPTDDFRGYPFYVAGEAGHRPPQPPLDMDVTDGKIVDGGLPRHVLKGWETSGNQTVRALANQDVMEAVLAKGSKTAQINARRVFSQNPNALTALAEEWGRIDAQTGIKLLDPQGEPAEKRAMAFHAGKLSTPGFSPVSPAALPNPEWGQEKSAYRTDWSAPSAGHAASSGAALFRVNGRDPVPGAPFADPCPAQAPLRQYKVGVIQTELTVNRHGWFDPQARILTLEQDVKDIIDPNTRERLPEPLFFRANSGDCINFKHSNFVPNALALDDFQIFTPTDTIGQHIHLVKFDVTSSDGSGNGFNYEDGTFSPDEVRERVHAYNQTAPARGKASLQLKTHPLFQADCTPNDVRCEALKTRGTCPAGAENMALRELAEQYPFCGAQRTVQRWWADPILDSRNGRDHTLRTVFTHDHFGPSSHQQHGLYAALVVEPANSVWLTLDNSTLTAADWLNLCSPDPATRAQARKGVLGGANLSDRFDGECKQRLTTAAVGPRELREPLRLREDGGPTSARANIVSPECLAPGKGERKDSNPLDPNWTDAKTRCDRDLQTGKTRREYALAFADFSVLYNTALEPINPESRDVSMLRFGRRQVPTNLARPLAISSEDPGTQLINYRNEPVPLRVTERTANAELGGFDYRQKSCPAGPRKDRLSCTGDMANVFSTAAHEKRDRLLATQPYGSIVSPATRSQLAKTPMASQLDQALADVEQWRKDFNCALYPVDQLPGDCRLQRNEPWRVMGDPATPILAAYEGDPVYVRLVQGAQEAQHVFAMNGYKWLREPDNPRSGHVSAQPLGISEHFEFDIKINPQGTQRADTMYMGSSIDQLWDGMWGLVRSYGTVQKEYTLAGGEKVAVTLPVPPQPGVARLDALPGSLLKTPVPKYANRLNQVCVPDGQSDAYEKRLFFDISAVRACELQGSCETPRRGISYNARLGLDDPNAIIFVRNNKLPGEAEPELASPTRAMTNEAVLVKIRNEFASGLRKMEPLVLRAPAGACMEVTLRNHLPVDWQEKLAADAADGTAHYSDNFMSMILDGFNYNQLRMSSSVGLSAPMLGRYTLSGDGANIGINGLEIVQAAVAKPAPAPADGQARPRSPTPRQPVPAHPVTATLGNPPDPSDGIRLQGNLVPACAKGESDDKCTGLMYWYAGDYALDVSGNQLNKPMELGAVPLSSFGDVIKHPAHGAIGALVIGPAGSKLCPSIDARERAAEQGSETSATVCYSDATGRRRHYRDFVMMLQDAVDAKIAGDRVANLKGAEEPDDYGVKAVNYRSEPLWGRRGGDPSIEFEEQGEFDYTGVLSSKIQRNTAQMQTVSPSQADEMLRNEGFAAVSRKLRCQSGTGLLKQESRGLCDPETPLFVARVGQEVRLRVVHPGGHTRQQAITLHGHDWNPAPWNRDSTQLLATHADSVRDAWTIQGSYNGIGPQMAANLLVNAGGRFRQPMDYLWRSQASFVYDGGIWGLLRVLPEPKPNGSP